MLAPTGSGAGRALLATIPLGWMLACRPTRRRTQLILGLGAMAAFPYLLLAPLDWMQGPGTSWTQAAQGAWSVMLRCLATTLVVSTTWSALEGSALRQGVLALPVPYGLALILVQVSHQQGELLRESWRMAQALALRRTSMGWRHALWLASSFPSAWMHRLAIRATRQGWAMDLRGYCTVDLRLLGTQALDRRDVAALVAALAIAALCGALRWSGSP